jgi:Xaa-Pro dipeptidase
MIMLEKIGKVQARLKELEVDGWLLYDFRGSNDLAWEFLGFNKETVALSRRFAYWIPQKGEPIKLISQVETQPFAELPGKTLAYARWEEYVQGLKQLLKGSKKITIEYSPMGALPTLSKVDGGTIELLKSFGVELVSSYPLLQTGQGWDKEKLMLHREAANVAQETLKAAWRHVEEELSSGRELSEYELQHFIMRKFEEAGCISEKGAAICAVNAHSADPHYRASRATSVPIRNGDWLLIDLWCKKNAPRAPYADICAVAVVGRNPTPREEELFRVALEAQQAAIDFLKTRQDQDGLVTSEGWEVDQAARAVIEAAGYGPYFLHRLGHNIDEHVHGSGTNLDNYETHDTRTLEGGCCFSIEPGLYFTGEIGVRLETDVYLHTDGTVEVTSPLQTTIKILNTSC